MIQSTLRFVVPVCYAFLLSAFAYAEEPESSDKTALLPYAIYGKSAPRAKSCEIQKTKLPLKLAADDRIALIGNTLFERETEYGDLEALIQASHAGLNISVRNLAWSADTIALQPRPDNFADTEQHLVHERATVILAAFGFNESFDNPANDGALKQRFVDYLRALAGKSYDGKAAPRVVLVSPTPNQNVPHIAAADRNNARLRTITVLMREAAHEAGVGFVDVYEPLLSKFTRDNVQYTSNGVHLTATGHALFAEALFTQLLEAKAPAPIARLHETIQDKNRQFFRRFRPFNTFYYTGERSKAYGYLDFLPAMRNFDVLVENRERRIWALSAGKPVPETIDDSNVPEMPRVKPARGANKWLSPADELKSFVVDPRFDVQLFASEEQFPELANPIQMRWDSRGRLWVSCSTTYPHVYPGREPDDKILILEDTNSDGRADSCKVFADKLQIPLSFELGRKGVFVSEMPHLVFLQDTNGDDRADSRTILFSGFGTEDSHHSLHDFVWTPDGDLLFRESIFHHSQVETPYGPVRMRNSGWFRLNTTTHRLTTFGSYPSTNPWGVTFDKWGQHVASHPVYAEAFHAPNPPYPQQHPAPSNLRAYSGTCGHEFIDFATFPPELQGCFIKNRYKPTNRIELLRWKETAFGFDEEYIGDLIFSKDLSFIPVDISFGPRGDLFICDWYDPVKGHAQYSLRDERRDKIAGRIWRVTAKGRALQAPPQISGAPIPELLNLLKRPEFRVRTWAKRELWERDPVDVKECLDRWVSELNPALADWNHHKLEALWVYRGLGHTPEPLLRELLNCSEPLARAAAVQQLRHAGTSLPGIDDVLKKAAQDPHSIVRMQAAIAASYIGTPNALKALLEVGQSPIDGHLAYAFRTALGSESMRRIWEQNPEFSHVAKMLTPSKEKDSFAEKQRGPTEIAFDAQKNVKEIRIHCVPEQMKFSLSQFTVTAGEPVRLIFTNPDATDHNLVIVQPGSLEEVGNAANELAKDPKNATSDFIPNEKAHLIFRHTPMIGPSRKSQVNVLRFQAPEKPGIYPFVCTYPGHWIVMTGEMIVEDGTLTAKQLLANKKAPAFLKEWTVEDLRADVESHADASPTRGIQAFVKAQCISCHRVCCHGAKIGPDLTKVAEKFRGVKLLEHIIEPSSQIDDAFRTVLFRKKTGDVVSGTIVREDEKTVVLRSNPLQPDNLTTLPVLEIEKRTVSKTSSMPAGLINTLTKQEILDLLAFLENGGVDLPESIKTHCKNNGNMKPFVVRDARQ
jgi:putative heme-binding domain-containing protein